MYVINALGKLICTDPKKILYRALKIDALLNYKDGCIFASGNMLCKVLTDDTYSVIKQLEPDERVQRIYLTKCMNAYVIIHTTKRIIVGKREYPAYDELVCVSPLIYKLGASYFTDQTQLFAANHHVWYVTSLDTTTKIYTITCEPDKIVKNIFEIANKMLTCRKQKLDIPNMGEVKQIYIVPRKDFYFLTATMLYHYSTSDEKMYHYPFENAKIQGSALVHCNNVINMDKKLTLTPPPRIPVDRTPAESQ
jgi:hypothetical protein